MDDRSPMPPIKPITEVADEVGIPEDAVEPYGRTKAKISGAYLATLADRPKGKLILMTAINPTKAGEGKTTTSIGLGDAMNRIGCRTIIALREPSLGPCFGQKGGATGGGMAQLVPANDINLHFTGDFHAITTAHNLLAALLDNHIHWGNSLGIDPRRVFWPRVVDMNDRTLRDMVIGLGGTGNGVPREARFDITAASEIMAVLCLARDLADAQERLGRIVVAQAFDGRLVTAGELGAAPAMAAVLRDALMPNLVQTLEHTPALVHGGPFANIAHGCNSVIATRAALALGDYVITEAGFGADLGAEKFLDIKCRQAGLSPDMAVVVATVRALKLHGRANERTLEQEDLGALRLGLANLLRHVENLKKYGLPVLVAINRFATDSDAELALVDALCVGAGVAAVRCDHYARGGAGAEDLARAVVAVLETAQAAFQPLYADDLPLVQKIETVAREIYRADGVELSPQAARRLALFEEGGYGRLPICIAKTQYSFSADPTLVGAPTGYMLPVREVRLSAGAGFVVAVAGEMMTMPGLPRHPASEHIGLGPNGEIVGLH